VSKFKNILDPRVIKPGMECRTCLDWQTVMDSSNDGDSDDPNDYNWFDGIVKKAGPYSGDEGTGYKVVINKYIDGGEWNILLIKDHNYEFFLIKMTDWDE
jgi:hypothetical protein